MDVKRPNTKNIPKPTNFGKNLKFLRRLKGLTQTDLAEQNGLKRNNIASYESGLVEPNAVNFLKLCTALEVDPREMLETIFSEHPADAASVVNEGGYTGEYLLDQVGDFTTQTTEMTKVLEGYTTFLEMREMSDAYGKNKELYGTLKDLLDLLDTLVKSNWNFIQNIYPNQEE